MTDDVVTGREFDLAMEGVRASIDGLAKLYADGAARATVEHDEVKAEVRAGRAEVAELRRQVDTTVVTRVEHERLKLFLYQRLDAVEATASGAMRRPTLAQLLAVGGFMVALAGLLIAAF